MSERSILAWLAIGLLVGVIGKLVMPARDRGGPTIAILVGVAGALMAGFIGETMH